MRRERKTARPTLEAVTMKLVGPETYRLACTANTFAVTCEGGTPKFSKTACSRIPKLYALSVERTPIYIGITKQPIRSRLRYGFSADGRTGYYGYSWRHKIAEATLSVWFQEDAHDGSTTEIETVEAEVVFLARCAGQWPLYQTEIHFHQSNEMHRSIAAGIWSVLTEAYFANDRPGVSK